MNQPRFKLTPGDEGLLSSAARQMAEDHLIEETSRNPIKRLITRSLLRDIRRHFGVR
jgi:hypothetical protein